MNNELKLSNIKPSSAVHFNQSFDCANRIDDLLYKMCGQERLLIYHDHLLGYYVGVKHLYREVVAANED